MRRDIVSVSKEYSFFTKKFREIMYEEGHYEFFPNLINKYDERLFKGVKFTNGKEFYLISPDITSWIILNERYFIKEKLFYIYPFVNKNFETEYVIGAEVINDEFSEIKIIDLLMKILQNINLNYFIDISSIKLWKDILKEEYSKKLLDIIRTKNILKLKDSIKNELIKKAVINLMENRGDIVNYEPFMKIKNIFISEKVIIDPSTFKYNSYYDNLLIDVYSNNGLSLGNGGSYKINNNNSCGFTLNLNNIIKEFRRN